MQLTKFTFTEYEAKMTSKKSAKERTLSGRPYRYFSQRTY